MSDNPEDYELVHYGVKGMKWGKRNKSDNQSQVKTAIGESGGSKGKTAGKTVAKRAAQVTMLRVGGNLISAVAPAKLRVGITIAKNLGTVAIGAAAVRDSVAIAKYKED